MPREKCSRGHSDWYIAPCDGGRRCRVCRRLSKKKYRQRNRHKQREQNERYRVEHQRVEFWLTLEEYAALRSLGNPNHIIKGAVRALMRQRGAA